MNSSEAIETIWTVIPICDECEYQHKTECRKYRDRCAVLWDAMRVIELENRNWHASKDWTATKKRKFPTRIGEYMLTLRDGSITMAKLVKQRSGTRIWQDYKGATVPTHDVIAWRRAPIPFKQVDKR